MVWVVLIAGGHGSGKRTVSQDLKKTVEANTRDLKLNVETLDMSAYQLEEHQPKVDFTKIIQDISSFDSQKSDTPSLVLVHGNYALYDSELRDLASVKIFLDTDADTRLSQWILRDVCKNISLESILDKYLSHCRPEYLKHIDDTRKHADVLLPRGSDELGLNVLATGILDRIRRDVHGQSEIPAFTTVDLRKELFDELDSRYYATI